MNRLNIDRLMETLSDILSEQHNADIRLKATPKEETKNGTINNENRGQIHRKARTS